MELESVFGEVLREIRLENKFSQEELAFKCGLDRTYISLLERGKRKPTITTVFILAEALMISPTQLISITEKRYNKRN